MSDYIKKTWVDDETITSEALNNIETGIAEAKKDAEQAKINANKKTEAHEQKKDNPHGVTLAQLGAFGFKRALSSVDDLDTLLEEGVYPYGTANIPKNCPYSNAGIVEVVKADSDTTRIIQRVTRYGTAGATTFRTLFENKWNEWDEHAIKRDVYYKAGDTFTSESLNILNGYTTDGGKVLYLFLPLNKTVDIATVTGATVNALTAKIRGTSGYIGGSSEINFVANASIWCKVFENGVSIKIESESAFSGATNNTPISAQIGSLNLTFNA